MARDEEELSAIIAFQFLFRLCYSTMASTMPAEWNAFN